MFQGLFAGGRSEGGKSRERRKDGGKGVDPLETGNLIFENFNRQLEGTNNISNGGSKGKRVGKRGKSGGVRGRDPISSTPVGRRG